MTSRSISRNRTALIFCIIIKSAFAVKFLLTIADCFTHDISAGHEDRMGRGLNLAGSVADSTATVLLRGESGTGKELIARAIEGA
jgi:transcriptional regulator with PAS, ATPase and Fis domain